MIIKIFATLFILISLSTRPGSCGVIKDLYQKITHSNNKTEDVVKQSAPICGNSAFSTPDEASLSPQIIFITNRPNNLEGHSNGDYYSSSSNYERSNSGNSSSERRRNDNGTFNQREQERQKQPGNVEEVAHEYTFHVDNVTLDDLQRRGFNRDAPVTFLMHGFTSGYPLQAWMSAIVEAYTIDRESNQGNSQHSSQHHTPGSHQSSQLGSSDFGGQGSDHNQGRRSQSYSDSGRPLVHHNLFIINWNYAARGIAYPRAVANIPIVASYATRFINDKLIGEAGVNPDNIQLIGHSLGAHLAGYIGKNTREKVGLIYGLDPAGPCFGALTSSLYPSSKRLAPSDAKEVITVQTNSALLGIDQPLGRYSIFVEGGANQPGCKGGGVLKSLQTLTWDGGDFDTLSCSHSRAPNLMTYRHDQSDEDDDCQMVAYACKDWDSFLEGHCGVCQSDGRSSTTTTSTTSNRASSPMRPVICRRLGLDWQYYDGRKGASSSDSHSSQASNHNNHANHDIGYHNKDNQSSQYQSYGRNESNYGSGFQRDRDDFKNGSFSTNERRPDQKQFGRNKRDTIGNSTSNDNKQQNGQERRRNDDDVEAIKMFLKTGDTQPFCTYHYQIVLELNEAFPGKGKPPMSIILQDSERTGEQNGSRKPRPRGGEQNSLSSDEFGNKFDERTYTHLLTSNKKLKRIDHATMIFRNGLENGHNIIKALHVNYMSHSDPKVRERLSSRLCQVRTNTNPSRENPLTRFFFKPCDSSISGYESNGSDYNHNSNHNNDHGSYNAQSDHNTYKNNNNNNTNQ